jgi:hypothetical protein
MDQYYKIKKSSTTGQKITEVLKRVFEYDKLKRQFALKYSIKSTYVSTFYIAEVGCVKFEKLPDDLKDNWKKGDVKQTYTLKAKPKNQELKQEWEQLLKQRIRRDEIDRILGVNQPFYFAGLDTTPREWFLIVTEHSDIYDFPKDVIEITKEEYLNLLHSDDVWPGNIEMSIPTDMKVEGLN